MKRTVKFAALALLATTAIFATSCGGNASKKQSADTATETATKGNDYANQELYTPLSADDWQKVVKANYDFDLTVPAGWSFKEGEKENANPTYVVDFNTDAADFNAALETLHRHLFDLTAGITPADGNFAMKAYGTPDRPAEKGDRITEITKDKFTGNPEPGIWHFNTPKGAVQLTFIYAEKTKFARITLVYLGKI
jgi:hypothetical protein